MGITEHQRRWFVSLADGLNPLSGIPTRGLLTSSDEAAPSIFGRPHTQFQLFLATP